MSQNQVHQTTRPLKNKNKIKTLWIMIINSLLLRAILCESEYCKKNTYGQCILAIAVGSWTNSKLAIAIFSLL
jgi:hypothetical protein